MKPWIMALATGLVLSGCATPDGKKSTAGPYDELADGQQLVADALDQASRSGRNVLLVFGANWCADCRAMDGLFHSDREIARRLEQGFVVVKIDVGRDEVPRKNAGLIERFHAAVDTGIPVLVVVDARGVPRHDTRQERLADSAHRDPARVLDFLRRWSE